MESKIRPTLEEKEIFLSNSINKVRQMTDHMDTQLNILIGISSAIFVFSASQYDSKHSYMFLILALFAACSALIGIVAVHPFKFMRKRGAAEGVVYNRIVSQFPSHKDYAEALTKAVENEQNIIEQYAIEIYNLYKFYYRPKRDLYILTRNVLIAGIFLSIIGLIITFILTSI